MYVKKALGLTAAVVLLLVGGLATPAAAATMCGDACNGQNPDTYWAFVDAGGVRAICGHDAITPTGTSYGANPYVGYGRTVQLRYSPTCRTVWARIFGGQSQDKIILEERQYDGSWHGIQDWEMFNPNTRNWSNMTNDAGKTIRACIQLTWATTPGSRLGCTGGW
jgi:hypothetical protein